MSPLAATTLHLPGLSTAPLPFLCTAAILTLGVVVLHQGLAPLEPVLGPRIHRVLSGAALGLFAAWEILTAAWVLGLAG